MPIFSVVVSPESLLSTFFWFTSLSQKPVTQPLLRGTAPNHLCFNLSHCSSASLQLVLEDPDFCCTHGNMFILGNLPNYLSTKCQHFTFYYWRGNNVSQVLFTFLLKLLFFCELAFLAQIGLKLTDILLPQIPKCWDYGHNPPCPFFTFHFLPKNRGFFPLRGFCFH